ESPNALRRWERSDVVPRGSDILRERLYCIHWSRPNGETFFRAPTDEDHARERQVETLVSENLASWQEAGAVPNMGIEPGAETSRLARERGFAYWHQCFMPRDLLALKLWKDRASTGADYLTL